MKHDDAPTWDFKSDIRVLQKRLDEVLEPEAVEEILFHISEILTDFNRLQHEVFAIVGRSQEQSVSTDLLVAALVDWFESLRSGWAPHWQDHHAAKGLALLKGNDAGNHDEESE